MSRSKQKARGIKSLGGGKYQVRVRMKDSATGKEVSRFETLEGVTRAQAVVRKAELQTELAAEQKDLHNDVGARSEAISITVAERKTVKTYAEWWLVTTMPRLRRSTAEQYANSLELHIKPSLGNIYLDELATTHIRQWQAHAAQKKRKSGNRYSPTTINAWLRCLSTLLQSAVLDGLIVRNPAAPIRSLPVGPEQKPREALEPDELNDVLELAEIHEPQHYTLISTLALTGARFGEIAALRWDDIDWEQSVIRIKRAISRGELGSTKTRKTRIVGLSSDLRRILLAHRQKLEAVEHPGLEADWVFPTLGKRPKGVSKDSPRPVVLHYPAVLQKPLRRLLKMAKIDKNVTPHGLRRSHVDVHRLEGIDSAVEHAQVGHSSERMREHYSHISIAERVDAAERISRRIFGKGRAECQPENVTEDGSEPAETLRETTVGEARNGSLTGVRSKKGTYGVENRVLNGTKTGVQTGVSPENGFSGVLRTSQNGSPESPKNEESPAACATGLSERDTGFEPATFSLGS